MKNARKKSRSRGRKSSIKRKGSKKGSKKKRSIKWKTIPKKTVNRVAPVNINISRSGSNATFRAKGSKNGLVVQHKELLQSITGSVAFNGSVDTTYQLNPGIQDCFPWLANIAQNYEQYVFNKLSWEYVPRCPSNTAGTIYMATSYDAKDYPPFGNSDSMGTYRNSISSGVWAPVWHHSSVKKGKYQQKTMVRTTAIDSGEDIREYDIGNFEFAVEGCANTNQIGQLWVHYSVTLFNPKITAGLPVSVLGVFQETGSPAVESKNYMGPFEAKNTSASQSPVSDPGRVDSNLVPIPNIVNHHNSGDPAGIPSRLSLSIPGEYNIAGSALGGGADEFKDLDLEGTDILAITTQAGAGLESTETFKWTAFMAYVHAATAAAWLAYSFTHASPINRWLMYSNAIRTGTGTIPELSVRELRKVRVCYTPAARYKIEDYYRRRLIGPEQYSYLRSCPDYEDVYGPRAISRSLQPQSREGKTEYTRQSSQSIDEDNDEIEPGLVKVRKPDEPSRSAPAPIVVSGQSKRSLSQDAPRSGGGRPFGPLLGKDA